MTLNAKGKNLPRLSLEAKKHKTRVASDKIKTASMITPSPRQSVRQCSGVSAALNIIRIYAMRLTEKPPIEKPENSESASLKPLHPKLKMYATAQTKSTTNTNIITNGIKSGQAVEMLLIVLSVV